MDAGAYELDSNGHLLLVSISFSLNQELNCSSRTLVVEMRSRLFCYICAVQYIVILINIIGMQVEPVKSVGGHPLPADSDGRILQRGNRKSSSLC